MSVESGHVERAIVYDAATVPDSIFAEIHHAHLLQLHKLIPGESDRITKIIGTPDMAGLEAYIKPIVNPNLLIHSGQLRQRQLFARSVISVLFDGDEITAALSAADNTSGSYIERWAKMHAPDGLPKLPGKLDELRNRRYLRLGSLVIDQNEALAIKEINGITVSEVALCALYALLCNRHRNQPVSAYVMPDDPADKLMVDLVQALKMSVVRVETNTYDNGYQSGGEVSVMRSTVGDILHTLRTNNISMPPTAIMPFNISYDGIFPPPNLL